jgi:hypothetical protein
MCEKYYDEKIKESMAAFYVIYTILKKSRWKILSQLDATYGMDETDYQYLHSWTQKWLFSETS